jgi:hypothetical protein
MPSSSYKGVKPNFIFYWKCEGGPYVQRLCSYAQIFGKSRAQEVPYVPPIPFEGKEEVGQVVHSALCSVLCVLHPWNCMLRFLCKNT